MASHDCRAASFVTFALVSIWTRTINADNGRRRVSASRRRPRTENTPGVLDFLPQSAAFSHPSVNSLRWLRTAANSSCLSVSIDYSHTVYDPKARGGICCGHGGSRSPRRQAQTRTHRGYKQSSCRRRPARSRAHPARSLAMQIQPTASGKLTADSLILLTLSSSDLDWQQLAAAGSSGSSGSPRQQR